MIIYKIKLFFAVRKFEKLARKLSIEVTKRHFIESFIKNGQSQNHYWCLRLLETAVEINSLAYNIFKICDNYEMHDAKEQIRKFLKENQNEKDTN